MLELNNRSQEQEARAYCASINADPDEVVSGYFKTIGSAEVVL